MAVGFDAQCGRCATPFRVNVGDPAKCPNPACEAVLLAFEGQIVWVRPEERELRASQQETPEISLGGRENGRFAH